jgi:hypothetical protein
MSDRKFEIVCTVLMIAALYGLGGEGGLSLSSAATEKRLTVFISDLHFGVGRDATTKSWHKEEDFRWQKEFAFFLKEVDRQGKGATDLILNGDTFELWQSLHQDCKYNNKDLGCTEDEALERVLHVMSEHALELRDLGQFADAGDNQVVLVPGNHDAALLYPRVKEAVLQGIPAKSGRIHVESSGYWRSRDGLLYAEHGHQIGKEVNKWDKWPQPFVEKDGQSYLQRPWGEQFVQEYYNQFERKYPIIDNISDELKAVSYGLEAEGHVRFLEDMAGFVDFVFFQVSWDQFVSSLGEGDGKPPEWDIDRIKGEGPRFFVDSLPKDHPFYQSMKQALDEGKLSAAFKEVAKNDNDIKTICDERAVLVKVQARAGGEVKMAECPRKRGTLGAFGETLSRARNTVLAEHLEKTCRTLEGCSINRFRVFVFSHTHLAVPAYFPIKKGTWRPTVVNTGAWQRVVTPNQLLALSKKHQLHDEDKVLQKLEVEDLPACYSVILVQPYGTEKPSPVLRYWRAQKEGTWGFSRQCS